MRRTKRGGWSYSQSPSTQFEINRDSPQAKGLVLWMPWGGGTPGTHSHVDRVNGLVFTEGGTPVWVVDGERGWSLLFDDGSNEYLSHPSTPVAEEPMTLACWFNSDSITIDQTLVSVGDSGGSHYFAVQARGAATGDPIRATSYGGATVAANTTTGYSANTWHHACAVIASSTSRAAYIDGGSKGTNTNTAAMDLANRTRIGVTADSTPFGYTSGCITDVRIYNRALSDTEVYELYRNPWELYRPLTRRGWPSLPVGGQTFYQSVAGAVASQGSLAKLISLFKLGTLSSGGVLLQQTRTSAAGGLDTSGSIVKRPATSKDGTLTSVGVLARLAQKVFAGTLSTAGVLVGVKTFLRSVVGTLSTGGVLERLPLKFLVAALTTSATLVERVSKVLAAALSTAGTIAKRTTATLVGTMSSSGVVIGIKTVLHSIVGVLSTAGVLGRTPRKLLAGSLSSSGVVLRFVAVGRVGTLGTVGYVTKQVRRILNGVLTSAATVLGVIVGFFWPEVFEFTVYIERQLDVESFIDRRLDVELFINQVQDMDVDL